MKIKLPDPDGLYTQFIFKSGENHIKLTEKALQSDLSVVDLYYQYSGDSSLIELMMLTYALRINGAKEINLFIPYFPGARQDRVCNKGEALSVKVYANLINEQDYDSVVIFDPHSDVAPALLDNVWVVDNYEFVQKAFREIEAIYLDGLLDNGKSFAEIKAENPKSPFILISPDSGSNKKIFGLSKFLGGMEVVRADKIREVKTGEIVDTQVFAEDLTGKICVIVDDIISGGRTFLELSKKLKEKGADKVYLVVGHHEGICLDRTLKDYGIDGVFTTNSLGRVAETDFTKVADVFTLMQ